MIRKEDWKIKFQNFAWPGTFNQPITFKVVITCACARACFCVFAGDLRMFIPPLSVF